MFQNVSPCHTAQPQTIPNSSAKWVIEAPVGRKGLRSTLAASLPLPPGDCRSAEANFRTEPNRRRPIQLAVRWSAFRARPFARVCVPFGVWRNAKLPLKTSDQQDCRRAVTHMVGSEEGWLARRRRSTRKSVRRVDEGRSRRVNTSANLLLFPLAHRSLFTRT